MYSFLMLAYSTLASATTYFLTAFSPGTGVHGALINAVNQGFYTGTSGPATYCPSDVKSCPQVQGSLVYDGLTGLAVAVPGGQKIYVTPTGQVAFTHAHSNYIPPGSFTSGWFNKTVLSACDPPQDVLDFLSTDGSNIGGVKLCEDNEDDTISIGASYRLYATTKGFNVSDCVDVVGLTLHGVAFDVGAWQYV
ncbi:hypothetical protein M426DRAFT_6609 [Hypoxylon sp. CI-4A]|nr:hypothetical protein M426DRAFT_6609 [Hypoxylon sp. CI-4A]